MLFNFQIYDESASEKIKLNDCFEVYGILFSSEESPDAEK